MTTWLVESLPIALLYWLTVSSLSSSPFPVYLLLGLIAMLVVLETFCELQQLKQLRKMFYLKKEKPHDQLAIMEHDHLAFSSDDRPTSPQEAKTEPFVDVPVLTSPGGDDPMIR